MYTIEIECSVCRTKFQRRKSEVKRNADLGRKIYCSRVCCGKDNITNLPKPTAESAAHLPKGKFCDSLSPFRYHLKSAKMHSKQRGKECSITLEQLKNIWDKQNGICPITGWNLTNPSSTSWKGSLTPATASLDRIDNTLGYVDGNVRFIAVMANFCRNKFTDVEVIFFCKSVVANASIPR